jgi:hypothetical protein
MPSARAASTTGAKRARLSSIVAFMLAFENPSEAEPKIATSSARAARARS